MLFLEKKANHLGGSLLGRNGNGAFSQPISIGRGLFFHEEACGKREKPEVNEKRN
jgi:hypothetical protein